MERQQITPEELQKLRDISIFDILGIRNTGRSKNIICPWHGDTNPSMTIYPEDNSYYCHGCSRSGSGAIDFLMESGGTFQEVINELSKF